MLYGTSKARCYIAPLKACCYTAIFLQNLTKPKYYFGNYIQSPNTILAPILQSPNIILAPILQSPNAILAPILQIPNIILAITYKAQMLFWHLFYKTQMLFWKLQKTQYYFGNYLKKPKTISWRKQLHHAYCPKLFLGKNIFYIN